MMSGHTGLGKMSPTVRDHWGNAALSCENLRAKKGRKSAQRVLASAHCWAPILVEWKSGQEEESNAIWGGLLDTIVCQMHPAIEDLKDVPYPEAQSTPRF